ncbi:hypothetical protein [Streptomyces yaizuensis]|uniref:Uncharacterized protein n=1 Tax=Streptomyces yaizuensis TaxID=2989713 RepID=A0ABQ5NVL3_9ACTN|nr:hypothetical protein [Streptomyces sp. YSPA8]GLF94396.1 hypothetical protein SYYSPA8_08885 [Streptomyces sp. YSPA8]
MISEPELIGADGEIPPRPPAPPLPPVGDDAVIGDRPPRPPRAPLRAWLWALGGAAVASALWAGGLYAYASREPDPDGYRVSADLCEDAEMKAVTALYGARHEPDPSAQEHAAMDWSRCWYSFGEEVTGEGYQDGTGTVVIEYRLSRRTDPGPQFDADVMLENSFGGPVDLDPVPDLGERAFFARTESDEVPRLHVLDGQAVVSLYVDPPFDDEGTLPADVRKDTEKLMIMDMRDLLTALRR